MGEKIGTSTAPSQQALDVLKPALRIRSYQVVVRPDAKQFSEVAEGHGSVGLEAEVWEVVGRGEVAALAGERQDKQSFCSQHGGTRSSATLTHPERTL